MQRCRLERGKSLRRREMDMPAKRFLVGRQVDSVVSYGLEDVIE